MLSIAWLHHPLHAKSSGALTQSPIPEAEDLTHLSAHLPLCQCLAMVSLWTSVCPAAVRSHTVHSQCRTGVHCRLCCGHCNGARSPAQPSTARTLYSGGGPAPSPVCYRGSSHAEKNRVGSPAGLI